MVGFFSGLRPFCDISTLQTHLFLSKTLLLRGVLHRMYPFVAYIMLENQFLIVVVHMFFLFKVGGVI